jgi:SAM-dependent methyltransferase
MNLYQRVLGTPFVYNYVRPLIVGGIDMSPFYDRLEATAGDIVLDVGCGTGNALTHLNGFSKYEGIDSDEVAIDFARKAYGDRAGVSFKCKLCTTEDVVELQPSRVVLFGLLHHISDEQILTLFSTLRTSTKLRRIVTVDIVYLPHSPVSNFLARLDRGKFCRRRPDYESLVVQSGLRLAQSEIMLSHPTRGLAKYLVMTIEQ